MKKLQVLLISFIVLVLTLSGCSKHDEKHSKDHEPKIKSRICTIPKFKNVEC